MTRLRTVSKHPEQLETTPLIKSEASGLRKTILLYNSLAYRKEWGS